MTSRSRRWISRSSLLFGITTALVLGTGAMSGSVHTADAAVCTHRTGVSHNDSNGGVYRLNWTSDSVCPNSLNAPVYAVGTTPESQNHVIGIMQTTSSWFLCWEHGAQHAGHNDIWYYTQGDVSTDSFFNAWGFMPARYVGTVSDPGDSRLPQCPSVV